MSKRRDGTYTGSKTISVRMPANDMNLLNQGLELSGLNQPDFLREAIRREVKRLKNIK